MLIDNDMGASRWSKGDNRPAYQRLPDVLQPGDVLVYWEPSRTGRDLRAYVDLRDLCAKRGVFWSYSGKLIDPSKGEDRFTSGLDALLAEKEAEQVRERVLRAHRANVDAGKAHGRIPYGYKAVRDENSGKIVARVPHPGQAPIVKEIAARILKGESIWSITNDLNERGVPTPGTSPQWRASITAQMIARPTYAGLRTHKGEVTGKGQWVALIDPDDHEKIRLFLSNPSRKTNPGVKPKHLLSGIAVCGVCGEPVHRLKNGGYPSYTCSSKNRCVSRKLELVDMVVSELVIASLQDPSAFAPIPEDESERLAALAEIEVLEARLEELVNEYSVHGSISVKMFAKAEAKLNEQIVDAKRRAQPKVDDPAIDRFVGPDARDVWEHPSTSVLDKREVIRRLCESITIMPTGKGRKNALDPRSIAIVLR